MNERYNKGKKKLIKRVFTFILDVKLFTVFKLISRGEFCCANIEASCEYLVVSDCFVKLFFNKIWLRIKRFLVFADDDCVVLLLLVDLSIGGIFVEVVAVVVDVVKT